MVLGLGSTGRATAGLLAAEGCSVTVLDDEPQLSGAASDAASELAAAGVEIVLAPDIGATGSIVAAADLVVPSPGVRPDHRVLQQAARAGVAVRSEIDIAAQRCTVPLIAVTGTNGKTTTTELIAACLRSGGRDVVVGGNIGTPLISLVGMPADVVVAEVSSFQLHFTTAAFHPDVAVLLNVADDHLDWHGDAAAYASDKAKLFAHQERGDVLVVNADDATARDLVRGACADTWMATITDESGMFHSDGAVLRDPDGGRIVAIADLPRALPHDLTNALCAAAAATAMHIAVGAIADALRVYATLPHRVQFIGENWGVRYYDDSKATNPHAAVRAARAFDSVVLLAGGLNKGLDLGALTAADDHIRCVVAFGQAGDEVEAAFAGHRPVQRAHTMRDAVAVATEAAHPGDVVLLSPGCASFDMYPGGYADRGDDFATEVRALFATGGPQRHATTKPKPSETPMAHEEYR